MRVNREVLKQELVVKPERELQELVKMFYIRVKEMHQKMKQLSSLLHVVLFFFLDVDRPKQQDMKYLYDVLQSRTKRLRYCTYFVG